MAAPLPSVNVGLFGTDSEFLRILGSSLGKKGTESDLRFWNKKEREVALTAIAPITYPEKLSPMLQTISMCDYPVLAADRLDAAFGETVVALGASGKRGLLVLRDPLLADRVHGLIRDRLRGWVTMDWSGEDSPRRFRELVLGLSFPREVRGPATVVLDHAFDVRGVGTVALGLVRRGMLRTHAELRLCPLGRDVTVRSIQRFDEDQVEAPAGSRVGLALKGVEAHELERGAVLAEDPSILAKSRMEVRPFARVEFAKDALEAGAKGLHLFAGAYPRPVTIDEVGSALTATPDRPMPNLPGEISYLAALRGAGTLRVVGHGPLAP